MAGVKGRSGGKRDGAGRKPKSYLYQRHIQKADKYLAPKMEELLKLLEEMARGQIEMVRETWKPAALILVERVELQEVSVGEDTRLVPVKSKVSAFPNKRPDDMVLVDKRILSGVRDRQALIYLVNRIMGRPAGQPEEPEEATSVAARYDLGKLTGEEIELLYALLEKAAPDHQRGESRQSAAVTR